MEEIESSARVSSKEEDDLLLRSNRKVKRKSDVEENELGMEVDNEVEADVTNKSYWTKLLESAIPFSAFDGSPDKELPPPLISKEDKERFKDVPITDEEFKEWCKPWKLRFPYGDSVREENWVPTSRAQV
ncbi:hypothetical protein GYH30_009238 [Glycine max]|nr:hypothetical protein GYH30_009238 [Glycine max]